jgi:undecaprenyl-diphosphatase
MPEQIVIPEWVQNIDNAVGQWFRDNQNDFLTHSFRDLTALGSVTVLALAALCVVGQLLRDGLPVQALLVALVAVGSYFASEELKEVVHRPRPTAAAGRPAARGNSFPSSHALRSAAVFLASALALRRRQGKLTGRWPGLYLVLWAVLVSLLIGASRVYLGLHYLSDVVAGWLAGVGIAILYALVSRVVSGPVGMTEAW